MFRPQALLGVLCVSIAFFGALLSYKAEAASTIAPLVSYQARLMDASGFPVADGTYSVKVSVYDASTGGTRLWTATGTTAVPTALSVSVASGLFSILLGDTSASGGAQNTLDSIDWNQDNLYIGVTIGSDSEMTPRRRLAATPQAFNARQLQGMYASSTAFGSNSLFVVNQTSATAATGTRTALEVRSSGTGSQDYLFRAVNDLSATVFSINREGGVTSTNVTTTNIFVSGTASTSQLYVTGQLVCLASGTNCAAASAPQSTSTLAEVSARGSFTTTTLQLYGGFVGSSSTVTSTFTVLGDTSLQTLTGTNATFTNATTTDLYSTLGKFVTASATTLNVYGSSNLNGSVLLGDSSSDIVTYGARVGSNIDAQVDDTYSIGSSGLRWRGLFSGLVSTNTTSTNVTTTNLYASGVVSTTQLYVTGQLVCLASGTNCSAAGAPQSTSTLAEVSARGSFATTTLQLYGGFVGSSSTVTSTFTVLGDTSLQTLTGTNATFTNATTTDLYSTLGKFVTASATTLNVYGVTALNGNVNIGDASADILTLTSVVGSNVMPQGTDNYSLGGIGQLWRGAFSRLTATDATTTNVTTTNLYASGVVSTTQLYVTGQLVCLASGTNCSAAGAPQSTSTLAEVSARGSFATTTLQLYGGFVGSSSTVTSTFTVLGDTSLQNYTFLNGTGSYLHANTRVSSLGFLASAGTTGTPSIRFVGNETLGLIRASDDTLGIVSSSTSVGLFSYSGVTIEPTVSGAGDGGDINLRAGTGTSSGGDIVLAGGTMSSGGGTAGNVYITGGTFTGGAGTGGSIYLTPGLSSTGAEGTIILAGAAGELNSPVLSFREAAANGTDGVTLKAPSNLTSSIDLTLPGIIGASSSALLTNSTGNLSFIPVCLTDGTNCLSSFSTDLNWTYSLATDSVRNATATTDIFLGSTATSTGAPAYFDLSGGTLGTSTFYFGHATNTNVVIGGTSTTQTGLNSLFVMNGNDLFVQGNIGSVSSVYTNGAFVAGAGSTSFGDGFISKNNAGELVVTAGSGTRVSSTLFVTERLDSPYLNRWFLSPLLRNSVYNGRNATTTVGTNPANIAFDGSHIWVTNGGSDTVSKIDITTNAVVATTTVGSSPTGIVFDGSYVWVSNQGPDTVSKIDVKTNAVVATVAVGGNPDGIAFDGSHLWVANNGSDTVSKIDIATNSVVATTTVGTSPRGVAFDGRHIWVTNGSSASVSKISIATNSVVATVAVGTTPDGIAFDGSHMWVTNFGPDNVSKIDVMSNSVVATTTVGVDPAGAAFDGSHIWVTNFASASVSKIDIKTNAVVVTTGLGADPDGIAFDGSHMWVANFGSITLTKLPIGGGSGANENYHVNLVPDTNNAYNIGSPTFAWGNIYASGTAYIGTDVRVSGSSVCLSNGTNCPSSGAGSTSTLAEVSARGSSATTTLQLYGGFVGSSSTVTSTLTVLGDTSLQTLTGTNATLTNVTTTNLYASGVVSTTQLYVTGQLVCLASGTNCSAAPAPQSTSTLAEVSARGSFATTTLQLYGGFVGSSSTVTSTFTVLGDTTLQNFTFSNGTGTNATTTNFTTTGNLRVANGSFSSPSIAFTGDPDTGIASGGGGTINFYGNSSLLMRMGSVNVESVHFHPLSTNTYDLGANGTGWRNVYVSGTVLATGGVFSMVTSTEVTSTALFASNATFTSATATSLAATNASTSQLYVAGQLVCLASGTNCSATTNNDLNWTFSLATDSVRNATPTTDIFLGSAATSTGAPAYFDLSGGTSGTSTFYFGHATNANVVIGGTSTTQTGLNSLFVMNGNDLFVQGNIGSVSSVYTNGAFVAGPGSTHFSDGLINKTDGVLAIQASSHITLASTGGGKVFVGGAGSSVTLADVTFNGYALTGLLFSSNNANDIGSAVSSTRNIYASGTVNAVNSIFTNTTATNAFVTSLQGTSGTVTTLNMTTGNIGTLTVSGNGTVNGDTFLGNNSGVDRTIFTSTIDSHFFPTSNDTYSLGQGSQAWRGFFSNVTTTNLFATLIQGTTGLYTDLIATNATFTSVTTTNFYASGTMAYRPPTTTSPFAITVPVPLTSLEKSVGLSLTTTATNRGLNMFRTFNGSDDLSLITFTDNVTNTLATSGTLILYNHAQNEFGINLMGGAGVGAQESQLTIRNLDSTNSSAKSAVELRNAASNSSTAVLTLRGGSNQIIQHVGSGTPEGTIFARLGSIYFNSGGSTSGTQAYLKTQDSNSLGWAAIATTDMLAGLPDLNWVYNSASDFARNTTATTDLVLGSSATSTGTPAYFDLSGGTNGTSTIYFGHATNTNVVIGGTSTTQTGLNSLFVMNGNDLFVAGNIGSASTVYSNGGFVAGNGSTIFGDGFISRSSGNLALSSTGDITLSSTGSSTISATGNIQLSAGGSLIASSMLQITTSSEAILSANSSASLIATITDGFSNPSDIEVYGKYLFVTNNATNVLHIKDITDPTNASSVAAIVFSGNPISVHVAGHYAYVLADAAPHFSVIDLQATNGPAVVGSLTNANVSDVYVSGNYAYVAKSTGAFDIIDVSIPTSPRLVRSIGGFTTSYKVAVNGKYAYVTDSGSGHLRILDISNPTEATIVTSFGISTPAGVAVQGRYAYVTIGSTMSVINIANPQAPYITANVTGLTGADNIVIQGRTAYVRGTGTMYVIDISNPQSPQLLFSFTQGLSTPNGIAVAGRHLYVANIGTDVITIYRMNGFETNSLTAHTAEVGGLQVLNSAYFQSHVSIGGAINVGGSGIFSAGTIVATVTSTTSTAKFVNTSGSPTGTAWGVYTNRLLVGNEGATGTNNYAMVLSYATGTNNFGGLCIDDTSTAPTCPTNPGASLLADGPIIANAFDVAETYAVSGATVPGDLVVLDTTALTEATVKASTGLAYDPTVIGVVSTRPGFVLGWNDGAKVALTGRVPLKVAMTNGTIRIGDALTSSNVAGHAMKATKPGMIVGYALENANATGTVETFVNVGYHAGQILNTDGSATLIADDVVMGPRATASSTNPSVDSWGLTFRGSVWDTASSSIVSRDFTILNDVVNATTSLLTVRNASGTTLFTLDDQGSASFNGDVQIGGRLFPSSRGVKQDDFYIFLDDQAPTGTYIATNADGWQSLDTYDFAERFYSPDELESGDLVVVKNTGNHHVQRAWNETEMLVGIVSTRPAFIAGRPATNTHPIALSGRVPTKVSAMKGSIKAGDPLAPSTIPGVAVKATKTGPIVGLALEDYDQEIIGKIEVNVNPGWWTVGSEVAAPIVTQTIIASSGGGTDERIRRGLAKIDAGQKKVHVSYDTIGSYPFVQVTPRGLIIGSWGTENYSDIGFDIVMSESQTFDAYFSWEVEPLKIGDRLYQSDGTFLDLNEMTGQPLGAPLATTTEEVIPEPVVGSEGSITASTTTSTYTPTELEGVITEGVSSTDSLPGDTPETVIQDTIVSSEQQIVAQTVDVQQP